MQCEYGFCPSARERERDVPRRAPGFDFATSRRQMKIDENFSIRSGDYGLSLGDELVKEIA